MDSLDAFAGTYSQRLVNAAIEKKVPLSGTFELLPTCNMRCKMCYIQHIPPEKLQPVEFWVDVFKQAVDKGMLFPLITGGEPFLYPDFFELYDQLIKLPTQLCINTNGTLLNREIVKRLAKKPPNRINISLYGASDATYEKLCGNPNGYTQTIHALELLKEYDIPVRIRSSIVQDNVQDYEEMKRVCEQLGNKLIVSDYMFPAYRKDAGLMDALGRLMPKEMAKVSFEYMKNNYESQFQEYAKQIYLTCEAFSTPQIYSHYGDNSIACRSGKCTFWIDWRGTMSGCGVHHQKPVDLKVHTFSEAWERIVEDTKGMKISEKCKFCQYRCICPVCAAASYCETGDISGTPEFLCEYCEEYAKILGKERKRLFGD